MAKAKPTNEPAPEAPTEPGAITGQLAASQAPAKVPVTFDPTAPTAAIGAKQFKVKQITRNVLAQRDGETIFVTVTGPIFQSEKLKGATGEQAKMAPPKMFEATNIVDGVKCLVIANAVLEGEFEKSFPKNSYVGKSFAITMNAVSGKRYKQFTVYEIEAVEEAA